MVPVEFSSVRRNNNIKKKTIPRVRTLFVYTIHITFDHFTQTMMWFIIKIQCKHVCLVILPLHHHLSFYYYYIISGQSLVVSKYWCSEIEKNKDEEEEEEGITTK